MIQPFQTLLKQRERICILSLSLLPFLPIVPFVQAAEIQQVTPLSFGSIDLSPAGDSIIIAAENGPASPTAQHSVVTGGNSGRIVLRSTTDEHVDITYPNSATLFGGGSTIVVTGIADHSQYSDTGVDVPGDNTSVNIHVGGVLTLTGNEQNRSYTGTMTITLYFN